MNGLVYSAAQARLTWAAASGSGCRTTGWTSVGWDSRKPFRSSSSGSDSRTVQRAACASRSAAVTAIRSDPAITPRNEPSRTCATTPAGRSAWPIPSSVAAGAGGRITRPNSMPGSTRSCRNRGRPVARASEGLYPAIDLLQSNSKMATSTIIGERHYLLAQEIRKTLAHYEELKDIIAMLGMEQLVSG